ncbi:Phosphoglycerate kinase, partial [mine drainage metagenome]
GRRDPRYSLRPVVHRVSALLGQPVGLAEDIVGYQAIEAVARMNPGDVLMLENLRFHPGEETNDPAFAGQLARLGDLFVEEAFGSVHRAHASTVGVPRHLPAFAGFLVDREVRELSRIRDQRPPRTSRSRGGEGARQAAAARELPRAGPDAPDRGRALLPVPRGPERSARRHPRRGGARGGGHRVLFGGRAARHPGPPAGRPGRRGPGPADGVDG